MPDGMNVDPSVIEEITREVKGFGDNFKAAQTAMQREVEQIRTLAAEAKGNMEPLIKSQMDALSLSIIAKTEAIDEALGKRLSAAETKLNRTGFGGGGSSDDKETRAAMKNFFKMTMAAKGQLKIGSPVNEDDVPYEALQTYAGMYDSYLRRDERALDYKALEVGSDPDGGYWVPPAVSNRIVTQIYESSPIRQIASVQTIGTDALELANDLGQTDAGWVGERTTPTETTTPAIGLQRINVYEMYAMPKATQRLLEDATIDVEAWLAKKVADKFARLEGTAFVNGTGVGQPRGILTYPDGTSLPGTIQRMHSGGATSITADGLVRAASVGLKEPYHANARWLMKRATIAEVMVLTDLQGRYIWQPGLGGPDHPMTLMGYPITFCADFPAVSVGAGAMVMALGDWNESYQVVDRLGITTLRDPFTQKPWILYYVRKRVGGSIVNFESCVIVQLAA